MDEMDLFDDYEMGEFDEFFSTSAMISDGTAALTGAGGILLASAVIPRIPLPDAWEPRTKSIVRSIIGVLAAWVGARSIATVGRGAPWARQASCGFAGAVGGVAIAQLVSGLAGTADDGTPRLPVGFAALPEEEALAQAEDELMQNEEYEMAQLAAAVTETDKRVMGHFSQTTTSVSPERLMGFAQEPAYNPALS